MSARHHRRHDPCTVTEWGRAVGISAGGLRNWCRTARLPARESLLFARLLRAVVRGVASADAAENLLNVVDRRTLAKMLRRAGGTSAALPASADEFLVRQDLIRNDAALKLIRFALRRLHAPQDVEDVALRRPAHDREREDRDAAVARAADFQPGPRLRNHLR